MRTFTKDDVREARSAMRFDGYNPYDTVNQFTVEAVHARYVREWGECDDLTDFQESGVRS